MTNYQLTDCLPACLPARVQEEDYHSIKLLVHVTVPFIHFSISLAYLENFRGGWVCRWVSVLAVGIMVVQMGGGSLGRWECLAWWPVSV